MPLTPQQLTFVQSALPFWDAITDPQRQEIAAHMHLRTYAQGERLHSASSHCSGLLLLSAGQLRAFIVSDTGREITLYRLLERDVCIFSASCLFRNISFDVFIEAEKPAATFVLPTEVFERLRQSSLAITEYTGQVMSSRFSDVMWVMQQALFTSLDKRLAQFLLEQAAIEGDDTLRITHETIARHLGSAREVVTRMLRYFQQEGLVRLARGTVQITNRRALVEMI